MSTWKRTAIETFPPGREIGRLIAEAKTPAYLWAELWPLLGKASDRALPDCAFSYAAWCLTQANLALQIMTLDGFYARIAEHPGVWATAVRHVSPRDAAELRGILQRRAPDQYANLMRALEAAWDKTDANAVISSVAPDQVAAIERAIAAQAEPWIADCPNCTQLKDFHAADLRDGERLPDAAYRLKKAGDLKRDGIVHNQFLASTGEILRCPLCGQFYDYSYDYEYAASGGTSESEWMKRIPAAEALDWCRRFPLQRVVSK